MNIMPTEQLIDPFDRIVSYLRVSVTDRCDFRCVYCMSEDMTFLPKREVLTLEELDRLAKTFISKGIDKIRITGGEPLVRRNVMSLIESLGQEVAEGNLRELTITTNGSQLSRFAGELYDNNVRRINISLDTLNERKFKAITRWGDLNKVMAGIDAAAEAGIKIKINTVALKGINDDELSDMLAWCGDKGFDLTLIETMPMGDISEDRTDRYLPLSKVREHLSRSWTLEDTDYQTAGPARYDLVKETGHRIGFITPMTHNFCESCNRVRLTCTGQMYMCLGQDDHADLRAPLRASEGNDLLGATIDEAISRKPKGHDFVIDRGAAPAVKRHMNVTGG